MASLLANHGGSTESMELSAQQLGSIIQGMRRAYAEGENAMAYARSELREHKAHKIFLFFEVSL